jgi:hypothetical protein
MLREAITNFDCGRNSEAVAERIRSISKAGRLVQRPAEKQTAPVGALRRQFADLRVIRIGKLAAGRNLLPDGLGFLVYQVTACVGGSAFSICRTDAAAGRDNLQNLRKM